MKHFVQRLIHFVKDNYIIYHGLDVCDVAHAKMLSMTLQVAWDDDNGIERVLQEAGLA